MKLLLSSFLILVAAFHTASATVPFVPVTDGNSLQNALKLAARLDAKQELEKDELIAVFHAYGYLRGYLGMSIGWSRNDPNAPFKLPDSGIPVAQFQQIVEKFLADHPERLHEGADRLLFAALVEGFPNPDAKK